MENKELLSHFRVHRKSTTTSQTNERIETDGPLYTGVMGYELRVASCEIPIAS